MKASPVLLRAVFVAASVCVCLCPFPRASCAGESGLSLEVQPDKLRLRWPLSPGGPDHSLTTRRWQLERSTSLNTWVPEGAAVVAVPGGPSAALLETARQGTQGFFRLRVTDEPSFLASKDGEAMGYVTAMDARMAENGGVTPQNFAALFTGPAPLTEISGNVTKAEYWAEWNADPAVWNLTHTADRRLSDFRLSATELALLKRNGFVVSEARGSHSFADIYYRIWVDDLPVYVSSDSILHAWHRTWINLLEELEELALRPRLLSLMNSLNSRLTSMTVPAGLQQGLTDAREFIGTARTLVNYAGTGTAPAASTWAGKALAATGWTDEMMFGRPRTVDWTQFGPRAHYANSEVLKSYFRSMMWLGLTDLRIDQRADDDSLRELAAAVTVALALKEGSLVDDWEQMDNVLTPFMGRADSLTPPQLLEILQAENLDTAASFTGPEKLTGLLARIESGQAGVQQILAHPILAPVGERKQVLPRSFAFFGQRFTPESWALTRLVFDNIWREEAGGEPYRVRRRLPSALDVNFAVMGNDTPAALLSQRMTMSGGVPFRDGYDYARELVSIRQVMDAQQPVAWDSSLYLHCLDAIRTLSAPLPGTVPEAMRTAAWKWKTVHTQMAAWTELRHDNLLYAKQSYTPPWLCFYPAGYVEPRPAFYAAMKRLVEYAHGAVASLPQSGTAPSRALPPPFETPPPIDRAARKAAWLAHFTEMSATLQTLTELAQAEVAQQPFSAAQTDFIRGLVETRFGYTGARNYTGWYPRLFLKSVFASDADPHPSEKWDPLVVDIHTDGFDTQVGDPGAVLYNSVGNVALMLVAIDVNGQLCLHGGPAYTYYEFTRPIGEPRLTDQEWKTTVKNKQQPGHPEWTSSFLVPGPITVSVE